MCEQIKDDYITISEKWTYEDICCAMTALGDMGLIQQIHMSEHYNKGNK